VGRGARAAKSPHYFVTSRKGSAGRLLAKMAQIRPVPATPAVPSTPADAWLGVPPPKPNAPSWWDMYAPNFCDCDGWCYGCCCMPCAYGEVMAWATEQPKSACGHTTCFCLLLPICGPISIPAMITDARKKTEEKIWRFHNTRGDPKAKYMGVNFDTHDKDCIIAFLPLGWCCGFGGPLWGVIVGLNSAANFAVMKKFKAMQETETVQQDVAMQPIKPPSSHRAATEQPTGPQVEQ
jgi:hypothetical protein